MPDLPRFGEYELESVIGEGAGGVVYRARSAGRGLVAVKVLPPGLAGDDDYRARVARELRVVRDVRHRHLVSWTRERRALGRTSYSS